MRVDGQEEHDTAVALIAKRNLAQGRGPNDYSEDEYVEAIETVSGDASVIARRSNVDIERALEALGDPAQKTVTESMLNARQTQILKERGYFVDFESSDKPKADDDARLDAMIEAITQIGKPGEERKDLAELTASRRDDLIAAAIEDGRIFESQAEGFRDLWETHPEVCATQLAKLPRREDYDSFTAMRGNGDRTILPDPGTFELHVAAEALLKEAGKDADDADAYVEAITAVTTLAEAAELPPLEAKAAIVKAVREKHRPSNPVVFLWRASGEASVLAAKAVAARESA